MSDDATETYGVTVTRSLEYISIEAIDVRDEYTDVSTHQSSGFAIKTKSLTPGLCVNRVYALETYTGSFTCGLYDPNIDEWLWRDSDQDIEAKRTAWRTQFETEKIKTLTENYTDYSERTLNLSKPAQDRIKLYNSNGGDKFRVDGWAYELATCELAELYLASNNEETPEITAYDRSQGCSGNQHSCARALANLWRSGNHDPHALPAAFYPLTGLPYYEYTR